jgi:hypothetical protein
MTLVCVYPSPHDHEYVEFETKSGKTVRFDFNPMFGPLFYGNKGMPLAKQPDPHTWTWAVFEEWHAKQMEAKGFYFTGTSWVKASPVEGGE